MNNSPDQLNVIAQRLAASPMFLDSRDAFLTALGLRLSLDQVGTHRRHLGIPSVKRLQMDVKAGDEIVGYLTVQPVAIISEEFRNFDDIALVLLDQGYSAEEVRAARDIYTKLPVLTEERFAALQTLLKPFVMQLSETAERLFLQETESEPDSVRKARAYILDNLTERMGLEEVARHAGMSPFHFCKVFKRHTGLTFTDFVNRARVEEAKRMLLKPRARITEVAYDVGFQSLSQFNRSFRRMTSQSPTEYRHQVNGSKALALAL